MPASAEYTEDYGAVVIVMTAAFDTGVEPDPLAFTVLDDGNPLEIDAVGFDDDQTVRLTLVAPGIGNSATVAYDNDGQSWTWGGSESVASWSAFPVDNP